VILFNDKKQQMEGFYQFIEDVKKDKKEKYPHKIKKAVERHIRDLKRDDIYFDENEANRHIKFTKLIPLVEYEWAGKLIELMPWQEFLIGSIYGWKRKSNNKRKYTMAYLQMPKKNGKTALAAILSIGNAIVDKQVNAQIFFAGYSSDTADICFTGASRMLGAMSNLYPNSIGKIYKKWAHSIELMNSGTFMKKVSSDANNLEGKGTKFTIVDEVHTHKNSDVIDNLRSGMALLDDPLMVCITTPGFNKESPAYSMYLESEKVLDGVIDKDQFFSMIFELDKDDDWRDKKNWAKANPNLGISPKLSFIESQYENALMGGRKQVDFLVKHMGLWVDSEVTWISDHLWMKHQIEMPKLEGRKLYCALDLASVSDFTSSCFVWVDDSGENKKYYVYWKYYIPEASLQRYKDATIVSSIMEWEKQGYITLTPGNVTDYHYVKKDILDIAEKNKIVVMNYDPYNSNLLVSDLIESKINMVQFSQQAKTMSPAIKELEKAINNGSIYHGKNPVSRWQLGNVRIIEDHNENFKFSKSKSSGKIDGIVSMAMAIAGANITQEKKSPTVFIV